MYRRAVTWVGRDSLDYQFIYGPNTGDWNDIFVLTLQCIQNFRQKVLRERMITWVYFHPKSSFPKLQKRPILVHNLMIS